MSEPQHYLPILRKVATSRLDITVVVVVGVEFVMEVVALAVVVAIVVVLTGAVAVVVTVALSVVLLVSSAVAVYLKIKTVCLHPSVVWKNHQRVAASVVANRGCPLRNRPPDPHTYVNQAPLQTRVLATLGRSRL